MIDPAELFNPGRAVHFIVGRVEYLRSGIWKLEGFAIRELGSSLYGFGILMEFLVKGDTRRMNISGGTYEIPFLYPYGVHRIITSIIHIAILHATAVSHRELLLNSKV